MNELGVLIELIYEAALDESKWPVFLEFFAATVGGCSALLRTANVKNNSAAFVSSFGYDPAWQQAYSQHFVKVDYLMRGLLQQPTGVILSNNQAFHKAEERKTEYYNDYTRPQDKIHAMGGLLVKEPDYTLMFAAQRGKLVGEWSEEERQLMQQLVPHVKRAMQIRQKIGRLDSEKNSMYAVLDQMRMGVILTDRFGAPHYQNRAATQMLSKQDGITCTHNRLVLNDPQESALLRRLIDDAGISGTRQGGDMRITLRNSTEYLHCLVTPVSEEFSARCISATGVPCVAIFLTRPGCVQLPYERLSALYRITPAEAKLASKLAALNTVEQAADELGITLSTARSQLKSIFAKTETKGQTELLMLLATGTLAYTRSEENEMELNQKFRGDTSPR